MARDIAEVITYGVNEWLRQEVISSDAGRNSILSVYDDRRNDFFKPFDDVSNYQSAKAISHHLRIGNWLQAYRLDPLHTGESPASLLIFGCLMDFSGSYRKQCFLESENETDYFKRRYSKPSGIDLEQVITKELESHSIADAQALPERDRIDHLILRTMRANDKSLELHRFLHEWGATYPKPDGKLAEEYDAPVLAMQEAQRLWARLATAHIIVAASFREGDITQVPVLEPKSISDASEILYPFSKP